MKSVFAAFFALSIMASANAVQANSNCTISAEEHKETNIEYEVGFQCPFVALVAEKTTKLEFVGGASGECKFVSFEEVNNKNVLVLSMDASKENIMVGQGCLVKVTFGNGHFRTISINAVEN